MINNKTKALLATTAFSAIVLLAGKPAEAFFGPVCFPTLPNCGCTYAVPCPVSESMVQSTTRGIINNREQIIQLNESWLEITQDMLEARSCRASSLGGVPGLGGIGINLDALSNINLSNLNIGFDISALQVPSITALTQSLQDLNLDIGMLQNVMDGNLDLANFLDMAALQGVSMDDLFDIGLPMSALTDLANGDMSTLLSNGITQMLHQVTNLDMNPSDFLQLVDGGLDVEGFLSNAAQQGISQQMLSQIGLDMNALESIASGSLMDITGNGMQSLLAGSSPSMQISERMFQDLMTGDATGEDLFRVMNNTTGMNPESLIERGLSTETLNKLTSGQELSADNVVDLSRALNTQQTGLNALGINQDLIQNIQMGNLVPDDLRNIAEGSGLSTDMLNNIGLNNNIIDNLPNMGEGDIMGVFQNMGISNNILDSLNIDLGVLGNVLEGNLPITDLTSMLDNIGLDLTAFVIPGLEDMFPDFDFPEMPDMRNLITIPNSSVPGLSSLLGNDCGLAPTQIFGITNQAQ